MTKKDLVAKLATELGGAPQKHAAVIWDAVWSVAADAIADGGLRIEDFGTFAVKDKPTRSGRNPRTGEAITVEAHKTVSFKPSPNLKDRVNHGK